MKFSKKDMLKKEFGRFEIWEHENRAKFPLDGAFVRASNAIYPKKSIMAFMSCYIF